MPKPNQSILPPKSKDEVIPDKYIISQATVEKQLGAINIKKAPGPDGISNWVLKDFSTILSGPVCSIYNSSIHEGKLPQVWKEATTIPIPKIKPPKVIESDLRPISLTASLSKELETHVVKWLWEIVKPSMDPYQFGAIEKCSTLHALIEMVHDWYKSTDVSSKKNYVHVTLVDYSKAFDRIDPNILLKKLMEFDIPIFLLHWIQDFLSDRSQRVRIGDILSGKLDIWGTVPQGTKLGIFLFILMINDLKTALPTYKYVDDITTFSISNDPKCRQLQEAMDSISKWSCDNKMRINTVKTKEMLISFQKSQPNIPHIKVNGDTLERVDCVTLLGVRITDKLTWGLHVSHIVKKAQIRLFFLTQLKRSKVSPKDIVKIYCTKIRPVLEYASPVWHGGLTDEQSALIEHIQQRALKIAYPNCDYNTAMDLVNLLSLHGRRNLQCKKVFDKMQNPDDKLHRILPKERTSCRNTRHSVKYELPKVNTERYKNSFIPYVLFNCQGLL